MIFHTRRDTLKLLTAVATGAAATTAYGASHATVHKVTIKGFAFEPAALTINAGDTVEFTNEDGAPHTATDENGAFDTGRLNRGQSASLMFPSAGTFDYICTFHPKMKGTITING